jgi:effector-binding domain-containing protein
MDTNPEIISLEPGLAIAIRAQLPLTELPAFFGDAFSELTATAIEQAAGPPFAIYHSFDPLRVDVEAVLPVTEPVTASGRAYPLTLEAGQAVQVRHVGRYEELGSAYAAIERWVTDHGRLRSSAVREVYLTPATVPPVDHVTLVVQPLRVP